MKKENYAKIAVTLLNTALIIFALIMVNISYTFCSRIIKKDYTTTNVRGIQITLPPKEWDYKTKNYLMISGSNPNAYLRDVEGEFETHNSPIDLFVFIHLYDLGFFAFLFLLAYLVRKFMKSISDGNAFNLQNVKTLRLAAQILLISTIIDFACKQILWYLLKDLNFADGTRVAYVKSYNYALLLLGGYIILAVVKIIEDGIKIKLENDLTV